MPDRKPIDIFLAEDNPGDILLLEESFKEADISFNMKVAHNGEEAIALLYSCDEVPDIMLLDINLPKLDGLEVLDRIRKNKKTSGIPILMLTSSKHQRDIDQAKAAGANGYIIKPGNFEAHDFLTFIDAAKQNPAIWVQLDTGA